MKIRKWLNWFIVHPRWTLFLVKIGIRKKLDFKDHRTFTYSAIDFGQFVDLLAMEFKMPPAEVEKIVAQYSPIDRNDQDGNEYARWDSSEELCLVSYCLCKIVQPAVVVETGTAKGFLAAAVLQALQENNRGELFSLELPPFGTRDFSYAGSIIPKGVLGRWNLRLGPSIPLMKRLFKERDQIDVFIHDSDHSYLNQKSEYKIAMRVLKTGGVLISDDVKNDAFQEVSKSFRQAPIYVKQKNKDHPIGFIFKR